MNEEKSFWMMFPWKFEHDFITILGAMELESQPL